VHDGVGRVVGCGDAVLGSACSAALPAAAPAPARRTRARLAGLVVSAGRAIAGFGLVPAGRVITIGTSAPLVTAARSRRSASGSRGAAGAGLSRLAVAGTGLTRADLPAAVLAIAVGRVALAGLGSAALAPAASAATTTTRTAGLSLAVIGRAVGLAAALLWPWPALLGTASVRATRIG